MPIIFCHAEKEEGVTNGRHTYTSFIQFYEAFLNIYLCQSEGVKTLKVYLFYGCQYLHETCRDTVMEHIYSF